MAMLMFMTQVISGCAVIMQELLYWYNLTFQHQTFPSCQCQGPSEMEDGVTERGPLTADR